MEYEGFGRTQRPQRGYHKAGIKRHYQGYMK